MPGSWWSQRSVTSHLKGLMAPPAPEACPPLHHDSICPQKLSHRLGTASLATCALSPRMSTFLGSAVFSPKAKPRLPAGCPAASSLPVGRLSLDLLVVTEVRGDCLPSNPLGPSVPGAPSAAAGSPLALYLGTGCRKWGAWCRHNKQGEGFSCLSADPWPGSPSCSVFLWARSLPESAGAWSWAHAFTAP